MFFGTVRLKSMRSLLHEKRMLCVVEQDKRHSVTLLNTESLKGRAFRESIFVCFVFLENKISDSIYEMLLMMISILYTR